MCLKLELNHTHVEKPTGNSWEKFINYRSSGRNRTHAFAMPVQCSCHWATEVADKSKRDNCGLSLRHIYPSEFTLSRVKCHKILIDLPSNLFAGITTLKYTIITLALVSYLRSSVVRALHRHRKGVGSIPAGGPVVDEFFSTVPGWFFDMCMVLLELKTQIPFRIYPHLQPVVRPQNFLRELLLEVYGSHANPNLKK